MGNCCASNSGESFPEIIFRRELELCFGVNENFDLISFQKSFSQHEFSAFSNIIAGNWKSMNLRSSPPSSITDPGIHERNKEQLSPLILKGVPIHLFPQVIHKIFILDENTARDEYSNFLDLIEDSPGPSASRSNIEPLFGRPSLSNLFLTKKGTAACRRLLYFLITNTPDIQLSLILPRVVQMLLWFLEEHEVFQLACILFERQYFPITIEEHKGIVLSNSLSQEIFQDIVFNMAVGYLKPCYYPQVLGCFLIEGILGVMKCAEAIIDQHSSLVKTMIRENTATEVMIKKFKSYSVEHTSISKMMIDAHFIAVEYMPTDVNCCLQYQVPFDGQSRIIETNQQLVALFSMLPSAYSTSEYKFIKIDIENLKYRKSLGFLLLLEANFNSQVAFFLDRAISTLNECLVSQCRIIFIDSRNVFCHTHGQSISVEIDDGISMKHQE